MKTSRTFFKTLASSIVIAGLTFSAVAQDKTVVEYNKSIDGHHQVVKEKTSKIKDGKLVSKTEKVTESNEVGKHLEEARNDHQKRHAKLSETERASVKAHHEAFVSNHQKAMEHHAKLKEELAKEKHDDVKVKEYSTKVYEHTDKADKAHVEYSKVVTKK